MTKLLWVTLLLALVTASFSNAQPNSIVITQITPPTQTGISDTGSASTGPFIVQGTVTYAQGGGYQPLNVYCASTDNPGGTGNPTFQQAPAGGSTTTQTGPLQASFSASIPSVPTSNTAYSPQEHPVRCAISNTFTGTTPQNAQIIAGGNSGAYASSPTKSLAVNAANGPTTTYPTTLSTPTPSQTSFVAGSTGQTLTLTDQYTVATALTGTSCPANLQCAVFEAPVGSAPAFTGAVPATTCSNTGTSGQFSVSFSLTSPTPDQGTYTFRCYVPNSFYSAITQVSVIPPRITKWTGLTINPSTLTTPSAGTASFTVTGTVTYADVPTAGRAFFCVSSDATSQLYTGANSGATTNGVATPVGGTSNDATITATIPVTSAPSAAPGDYGVTCYGGTSVSAADARRIVALGDRLASPVLDAAVDATVTSPRFKLVPDTATSTAPTVVTTGVAGSPITLSGFTTLVTDARPVKCQTTADSPSSFSFLGAVVPGDGTSQTQTYSATSNIPSTVTNGVNKLRCILCSTVTATLTTCTPASVTGPASVTFSGGSSTPTASPPTAPTSTPPTATVAPAPFATLPPTPPGPGPSPGPGPRPSPPPVCNGRPTKCSKDDEYIGRCICEKCISTKSPFKQVFGGSTCVNPITLSSKSTKCSVAFVPAYARKPGSSKTTQKCISLSERTISILVNAAPVEDAPFLNSSSFRKTSLRLGNLRPRSSRGLVVWVAKGKRQLVQFDDRFKAIRKQKGKVVKLTGTLRPYVGASLLRCFTAYLRVCSK